MAEKEHSKDDKSGWARIISATGSPLKLFALTILVCNAVFGIAGSTMNDLKAFMYSLHVFVAVISAFVLIALWSPRSFYHPNELAELRQTDEDGQDTSDIFPIERPAVATAIWCGGLVLYAVYQYITRKVGGP